MTTCFLPIVECHQAQRRIASRYAIGGMRGAQDHQARLMRYQWFGSCMLESLPWLVHFLLTKNRQFGFDVTAFMPKMFTHQIVA
ncbi:hypothetical protein [Rhodanobacter sp. T12-5]|uniref:hypothetical protein n=1 Tax=Rhodanobacter sp. T12-5 TaxID=2024611 RepID=UPI001562E73A|nr:hypothetical protein [Rhodanobacter sp. T12-5]